MHKLRANDLKMIRETVDNLCRTGRYSQMRDFTQHGTTSVFEHCLVVSCFSLWLANELHIRCRRRSLVKGALLHDYFLYDWHIRDKSHSFHGFTHARRAFDNASQDWSLDRQTGNIILRHMFPLVPVPPTCRESWIVCISDKICAACETVKQEEKLFALVGCSRDDFSPDAFSPDAEKVPC